MNTSEVLLLGPGPSPVPHPVLKAQAAPVLGHLDPEFLGLMEKIKADLRMLLSTENDATIPISGTGSAGMETCFVNLVEPGDRVVVGRNGVFGMRMAEVARRLGAEVVEVHAAFGHALDPDEMRKAILDGPTKVAAWVHAETSTGVLQPLAEILEAAEAGGALSLVDCVTSFCGAPLAVDPLGIDCMYTGTQKCLSVPPGLAPVTFGGRAMEAIARRERKSSSWYLDLGLLTSYWGEERVYHHTAPISALYGLAQGLALVVEEGLEARHRRHAQVARSFWAGLAALGLEPAVPESVRAPMLTSVRVPDGVDELAVRKRLRQVHLIEIGGGLAEWKGKVWRVGLMGHGARITSVVRLLTALAESLASVGKPCDGAAAVSEALRLMDR